MMIRILFILIFALSSIKGICSSLTNFEAPDSINTDTIDIQERFLEISLPEYEEWDRATINGKLKMKGLPLSPSIRIFMEKDSLLEISIKAPFMGEVGRIVMTQDTLLGVNKINKTFTKSSLKEFLKFYPGGLSELQSLLLGRVVMPGIGEINDKTVEMINFMSLDNGFALVPAEGYGVEGFEYGYVVDENLTPSALLVIPEFAENVNVSVIYENTKEGLNQTISYLQEDKAFSVEFQMRNPEWSGESSKTIIFDNKYRELPIGEFIKNFGR